MKLTCVLLLLLIHPSKKSQGQTQTDTCLVAYAQVWGFLKYYHPYPSAVDWDKQLVNDYTLIKNGNALHFRQCITHLLQLCEINNTNQIDTVTHKPMQHVFEWTNNPLFTIEQKQKLKNLYLFKPNFTNPYAKPNIVGSVNFDNEKNYALSEWNEPLRFLAIARYWNIINYFFPYRDLIPQNWTTIFYNHLHDFIDTDTPDAYCLAVMRLTNTIEDGHAFIGYSNEYLNAYKYPPFYCMSFEDGTFITYVPKDSIHNYPLTKGDKILVVDGIPVEEKWKWVDAYFPSSNQAYAKQGYHIFRRTLADTMRLTVLSNGTIKNVVLPTFKTDNFYKPTGIKTKYYPPYTYTVDSQTKKKYIYIDMRVLECKHLNAKFKKTLKKADYAIVDCRNYPKWTVIKLTTLFIKGNHYFAKALTPSTSIPGTFSFEYTQKIHGKREFKGKLYILVDHNTMSQAEYTVMALQLHPRAITIGAQTAGADGNVTRIPLPFNISTKISGIGIVYPDGTQTQQIGIKRDVKIEQKSVYLNGIKNDVILNKALELMFTN